jgi:hypothetical protein
VRQPASWRCANHSVGGMFGGHLNGQRPGSGVGGLPAPGCWLLIRREM